MKTSFLFNQHRGAALIFLNFLYKEQFDAGRVYLVVVSHWLCQTGLVRAERFPATNLTIQKVWELTLGNLNDLPLRRLIKQRQDIAKRILSKDDAVANRLFQRQHHSKRRYCDNIEETLY